MKSVKKTQKFEVLESPGQDSTESGPNVWALARRLQNLKFMFFCFFYRFQSTGKKQKKQQLKKKKAMSTSSSSSSTAVRSRLRNGGELPAKPASHISSMLVPPTFTSHWRSAGSGHEYQSWRHSSVRAWSSLRPFRFSLVFPFEL